VKNYKVNDDEQEPSLKPSRKGRFVVSLPEKLGVVHPLNGFGVGL
jgi:hypothetical protein